MMNIGLFFGAGGSVIYEKPTTLEFRKILTFDEDSNYSFYNKKPIDQIMTEFLPEGDIEDVLEALKNIFDFNESLGNKLFNLAFPEFYRLDGGAPVATSRLVLEEADYRTTNSEKYTKLEPIFKNTINKFKYIQQHIYKQIFREYEWKNKHDDVLNSIMKDIFQRLSEHKIFVATTNYDQAFEKYCNNLKHLRVIDGFERDGGTRRFIWTGNFKNSKQDNHIAYYKLHGSLNWRKTEDGNIMSIDIEDFGNVNDKDVNCLIYPTISPKDGALNEPFKTIFKNFKESLRNSDVIIIVGFSFRDLEITKLFKEFHESGGKIVIIDIKTPMLFLEQLGIEEDFTGMAVLGTTPENPLSVQLSEKVLVIQTEFNEKTIPAIFDQISESFFNEPPFLDALDK